MPTTEDELHVHPGELNFKSYCGCLNEIVSKKHPRVVCLNTCSPFAGTIWGVGRRSRALWKEGSTGTALWKKGRSGPALRVYSFVSLPVSSLCFQLHLKMWGFGFLF